METLDAIFSRKSTRSYKPQQIHVQELDMIIKAGCAAPVASAKYDSLHITAVQDEAVLQQIMTAASDAVFRIVGVRKNMDFGAKTLIIVSAGTGNAPGIEYANAGCVLENMVIAATSMGIDSVIWGAAAAAVNADAQLKKQLAIPEGLTPLLCASFGYAEKETAPKEHHISVTRI